MAASRGLDEFMISIVMQLDAIITLSSVTVALRAGFVSIYEWDVFFTYVTGAPSATAFRLNSADGLTGSFSPSSPEGYGPEIRSGVLSGTVQRIPGVEGDVTYNGTVAILQV